jgi:hypothetical protein
LMRSSLYSMKLPLQTAWTSRKKDESSQMTHMWG